MVEKHSFSKVKIGSKTTISFFQNFNGSISNSKFVCTFANFGWHTSFRWSRQFVSESSIYTCDFGVEREFFRNLPSAEIKRKMIVKHSFSKVKIGSKTTISFFQNFNGSISNSVYVCTFANFGWHTSFRWSRQFVSESSIYTCDFGVEREFFRNLPSAEIKRKMIVKHSFSKVKIGSKTTISFFKIQRKSLN
jgi:predicted metal-dependent peptidase